MKHNTITLDLKRAGTLCDGKRAKKHAGEKMLRCYDDENILHVEETVDPGKPRVASLLLLSP